MYENKNDPLLPRPLFYRRVLLHSLVAFGLLLISLCLGIAGYRFFERMAWIDALLNAAMILGGMGPVNTLQTTAGKLFASAYAIFSGVVFLAVAGIVVAPIAHRLLHRLHLDSEN